MIQFFGLLAALAEVTDPRRALGTRLTWHKDTKWGLWHETSEISLYASFSILPAAVLGRAIRLDWGIENRNNYVRDVSLTRIEAASEISPIPQLRAQHPARQRRPQHPARTLHQRPRSRTRHGLRRYIVRTEQPCPAAPDHTIYGDIGTRVRRQCRSLEWLFMTHPRHFPGSTAISYQFQKASGTAWPMPSLTPPDWTKSS
jgi:hypothetical protein